MVKKALSLPSFRGLFDSLISSIFVIDLIPKPTLFQISRFLELFPLSEAQAIIATSRPQEVILSFGISSLVISMDACEFL